MGPAPLTRVPIGLIELTAVAVVSFVCSEAFACAASNLADSLPLRFSTPGMLAVTGALILASVFSFLTALATNRLDSVFLSSKISNLIFKLK